MINAKYDMMNEDPEKGMMKMTVGEAIQRMIRISKLNQTKLALKLGKSPTNIGGYLRTGDGIKLKNLMAIADVCDYDIILVRKGTILPFGVLKLERDTVTELPRNAEDAE